MADLPQPGKRAKPYDVLADRNLFVLKQLTGYVPTHRRGMLNDPRVIPVQRKETSDA